MSPLTPPRSTPPAACATRACPCGSIADGSAFQPLSAGRTHAAGRRGDLPPPGGLRAAVDRLRVVVDADHAALGLRGFFPVAARIFRVGEPARHRPVPRRLSPFGYTSDRGS